ncbi:hypothetical protein D3C81_2215130 [compost metagenome]
MQMLLQRLEQPLRLLVALVETVEMAEIQLDQLDQRQAGQSWLLDFHQEIQHAHVE